MEPLTNVVVDPWEQMLEDLAQFVEKKKEEGHQIILMIDANQARDKVTKN